MQNVLYAVGGLCGIFVFFYVISSFDHQDWHEFHEFRRSGKETGYLMNPDPILRSRFARDEKRYRERHREDYENDIELDRGSIKSELNLTPEEFEEARKSAPEEERVSDSSSQLRYFTACAGLALAITGLYLFVFGGWHRYVLLVCGVSAAVAVAPKTAHMCRILLAAGALSILAGAVTTGMPV